jgi:hypothetical protein
MPGSTTAPNGTSQIMTRNPARSHGRALVVCGQASSVSARLAVAASARKRGARKLSTLLIS